MIIFLEFSVVYFPPSPHGDKKKNSSQNSHNGQSKNFSIKKNHSGEDSYTKNNKQHLQKKNRSPKGHDIDNSKGNTLFIWGHHGVLAVLKKKPQDIEKIFLKGPQDVEKLDKKLSSFMSFKEKQSFMKAKIIVDEKFFQHLSQDIVHQGIGASIFKPQPTTLDHLDPTKGTVLALDNLTDPHNIGALWRSAAALGAQALILTRSSSPDITGTLIKCASGAVHHLPHIYCNNFNETLNILKKKGFFVVGLSHKGQECLHECSLNPVVLVVGGEGKGLRSLTEKTCDMLLSIATREDFGVLNASVAGSIALYHFSSLMSEK